MLHIKIANFSIPKILNFRIIPKVIKSEINGNYEFFEVKNLNPFEGIT